MKKLMISMLLASPLAIHPMDMENDGNTIQANERTRLINSAELSTWDERALEEQAIYCCWFGHARQKYEQIKEERDIDFQLRIASKKRQLATALAGIANITSATPTPSTAGNAASAHVSENRDCNPEPCCTWFWCGPCLACDKCCCEPCLESCKPDVLVNEHIKEMEKKKEFIALAKSLGYHEDQTKRKEDDKPWIVYAERYIRNSNTPTDNNE
jgi:hypothetical protein